MSKQVFWEIRSLDELVLRVNGTGVSGSVSCKDLPAVNAAFEVLKDDGDVDVLCVETTSQVSIDTDSGTYFSAVAEFIGEKPRRPK